MLLNYETVIVGERCVLVPYRPQHVPTYHSWMQDPELLLATASEPLTLTEEYEMQSSWRDDPNKCTCIVLDRESCSFRPAASDGQGDRHGSPQEAISTTDSDNDDDFVERNLHAMAGDVNLFLSQEDDDEGSADEGGDNAECIPTDDRPRSPSSARTQAEIDIMIAEPSYRGKGLGREACTLMIRYGALRLNVRRFYCKINESNDASIHLFKSLGFTQCGYAECFREVELELRVEEPSPKSTPSEAGCTTSAEETSSKLLTFTSRTTRPDASPTGPTNRNRQTTKSTQ